ncbi:MAG: NOP5/NOP56 family protein [Thermoplasmatota archaeon]
MTDDDKIILHTTWFGSFLVENGEVIEKKLFPEDVKELAERRYKKENGEVLDEEIELVESGDTEVGVLEDRLSGIGVLADEEVPEIEPEEYSLDTGMLQEVLLELGRIKLRGSVDHGKHMAKAVDSITDINETLNILSERLRDWYSLHFPELQNTVDRKGYFDLIAEHGDRDKIMEKIGKDIESTGGEITEEEAELYRSFAGVIKEKIGLKEELEEYVKRKMKEYAPTLTTLTGPKLGGELISAAGSLKSLAMMPSSTVQVLGAEKSLFKHLKKGTPPPKHGYILQHPYVHKAEKELRGKVARALANKIAIAARVDYFGSEDKGRELKDQLEERIKEIKEQGK